MSDLNSLHDISDYSFSQFSGSNSDSAVKDFTFDNLSSNRKVNLPSEKRIKIERTYAKNSGFKIDNIVTEARGLRQQEADEIEKIIADEVEKRINAISENAFKEGHDQGVKQGREDILVNMKDEVEERLASLSAMVSEVVRYREDILKSKNLEIYKTIKTLTRWIILRELKDDGEYIERLLEKLIIELDSRKNILIQVNQRYFETMPDVLKIIEEHLGKLENVRIELDYDIEGVGIVVESENGIVDGTLDVQLNNLDNLFKDVGV